MYERTPYLTEEKRLREGRYRRVLGRSVVVAVAFHAALVALFYPMRETLPLVHRSGYRGPIQLLPEISVLREPSDQRSDAETTGSHLGASGFEVVDLRLGDVESPERPPTETEVEELDTTLGDDPRNLRDTSLPQPSGQEIVIEHMVEPVYPPSAIARGIEGVAVFGLSVGADGAVTHAWLVESEVSGECNLEARRALLQWRFAPYHVDGRPVPFLKYYRIRFDLRDGVLAAARAEARSEGSAAGTEEGQRP
jgi:TonB family protein